MSDSPDASNKSYLRNAVLPGALAILVLVSGYLSFRPALESARPKDSAEFSMDPPTVTEIPAVSARLWQDPLAVAYEDMERRGKGADSQSSSDGIAWARPLENLADFLGSTEKSEVAVQKDFQRLFETKKKGQPVNQPLLVMPVLTPGPPFAETAEVRMRARYAILAGLAQYGLQPVATTRISYVPMKIETWFDIVQDHVQTSLAVPVQLLRVPDAKRDKKDEGSVLLVWIDQDRLGDRPLQALQRILHYLLGKIRTPVTVAAIGPRGSDMLLKMEEEATGPSPRDRRLPEDFVHRKLKIYSPYATASDGGDLKDSADLIRAIGTDDLLVKALREELSRRGKWPTAKTRSHIVLVTERDTRYGRAIEELFQDAIGEPTLEKHPNCLRAFSYLRGVDGCTPGGAAAKKTDGGKKASNGSGKSDESSSSQEPLPEGPSQLDYLRRLEASLCSLQEELKHERDGEVSAVGVVGTDFYDKLLVLRALKKRFPRAVFFTADLEAGFMDPLELPTTRNLIVASHFGLGLNENLQRGVPPFRDSYQTAVYLATLMAVRDWRERAPDGLPLLEELPEKPWEADAGPRRSLQPLVFEIGRHGPYQLTMTGDDRQPDLQPGPRSTFALVQPRSDRERPWGWEWKSVLLSGLGLLLFTCVICRPAWQVGAAVVATLSYPIPLSASARQRLWQVLGIGVSDRQGTSRGRTHWAILRKGGLTIVGIAILIWLAVKVILDHRSVDGEPFALSDGISVWPTAFVRLLTLVLSVWWLLRMCRATKESHEDIYRELFGCKPPVSGSPVWRSWAHRAWKLWQLYKKGPKSWKDRREEIPIKAMYLDYVRRSDCILQCLRVALMFVCFALFTWPIFVLFGAPSCPYRGKFAYWTSIGVVVAAGIMMHILTLVVFAVTERCRYFVQAVRKCVEPPPLRPLPQTEADDGEPADRFPEFIAIRLIAKHTKVVGWFVVYPFVVLLLMIVSRVPLFDSWDFPAPLVLVFALVAVAVLYSAWSVRDECQKIRKKVLDRLRVRQACRTCSEGKDAACGMDLVIAQVRDEDRGGFASYWEHPVFLALSLPIGGTSLLFLVQQLFV